MNKKIIIIALIIVAVGITYFINNNKSEDNYVLSDVSKEETGVQVEVEAQEETYLKDSGKQKYQVTFKGLWNKDDFKDFYSSSAHFSPLVIWTQDNNENIFVGEDKKATKGLEVVAESGNPEEIKKELEQLKKENKIGQYWIGDVFDSPGSHTMEISLNSNEKVFAVSMIAPSPDWFIGISEISLFKDEQWKDDESVYPDIFDAGTENGEKFWLLNLATSPQENISKLKAIPVDTLPKFSQIIFERK